MPTTLKEIFTKETPADIIAELRLGRLDSLPATNVTAAQWDPELHAINDRRARPDKIVYLDKNADNYGETRPLTFGADEITDREVRIEPVARIALALQKLIVKRAVAFTFGTPVTYSSDTEDQGEKDVLKAVRRVFHDIKEPTLNRKAARALYSATEVAEMWYPVECPEHTDYGFPCRFKFKCALFSPLLGDRLYPYFDEQRDLIAFSREFTRKDNDLVTRTYFETYTATAHYLWSSQQAEGAVSAGEWEMAQGYPKPVAVGKIPVIYAHQEQTEWADVQTLIERLEKLLSNFADTNDYHASPKIFVQGRVSGFAHKGEAGAIIEGEDGASASYLSWASAPESVKLEVDTLLRMIYTITQTPDISFDTVKGIGAVSGVALKLLFMDAHLKVQDKTEIFGEYLQRRANLVKAYIGAANTQWQRAASSLIIEPKITPYVIEDELGKINVLQAANGGKAVASQRATVERLGWSTDTDAEMDAISAEEASAASYLQGEPTF